MKKLHDVRDFLKPIRNAPAIAELMRIATRLARMYGSYIGEAGSYPIECRRNQSFPLGWCYKRLMNEPEDNVWHKVQTIYPTNRADNVLKLE